VVVEEGATVTGTPLLTVRLPGVMTPVPLEKTPVRLEVDPAVIEEGLAVKLEIDGETGFAAGLAAKEESGMNDRTRAAAQSA
jgi:hypothetical protein